MYKLFQPCPTLSNLVQPSPKSNPVQLCTTLSFNLPKVLPNYYLPKVLPNYLPKVLPNYLPKVLPCHADLVMLIIGSVYKYTQESL